MKFVLLLALALLIHQISSKGKTYDDLDDIIKHQADGKIARRDTHKAYQEPQGTKIDPSKVVHKRPSVQEESALILPTAQTTVSNKTKVYTKYASASTAQKVEPESLDKTLNALAFKYFQMPPKHQGKAQFQFFMTSLLLLGTAILFVTSFSCLFYFLIKRVVDVQRDLQMRSEGLDLAQASTAAVRRPDSFQQFADEEEPPQIRSEVIVPPRLNNPVLASPERRINLRDARPDSNHLSSDRKDE